MPPHYTASQLKAKYVVSKTMWSRELKKVLYNENGVFVILNIYPCF